MVQALARQKREELSCNKRQIASDDDGPLAFASCQRCMKTTERSPLRIDIRDAWEIRSQAAHEYHGIGDLQQSFENALGERLAFNQQLRLVSSHSSGGAAGEDKGFHIERDYPVNLENPEILYENAEIL